MQKTKFRKGQKVKLSVNIMGIITYGDAIISKINNKGVWLDNGPGNDESGPFDKITGYKEVFMGSQTIAPIL